jgi:hypothetical protein
VKQPPGPGAKRFPGDFQRMLGLRPIYRRLSFGFQSRQILSFVVFLLHISVLSLAILHRQITVSGKPPTRSTISCSSYFFSESFLPGAFAEAGSLPRESAQAWGRGANAHSFQPAN